MKLSRERNFFSVYEHLMKKDNKIITEITWCGDTHLLVRVMNRIQDIQKTVLVDARKLKGKAVREENTVSTDGGWFEIVCNANNNIIERKKNN